MKNVFIALSICFCFSQSIGQSKDNKPTSENKNVTSIIELIQGKWQSIDDKTNFLMFDENERNGSSDGMKTWDKEAFVLSNKCLNESDKDNPYLFYGDFLP